MMTDEQYIDWLFQQEPCGYEKTPGFRAFLLDAMAAIGERPRTGDVASMHMAYRVALELKARCFDGAKWSRRETPADPFQEVAR